MDVDWQKLGHEEKLKYLLLSGHLADVSFVVGEAPDDLTTFACHKWVLQCASPVFERMFHGDFKESNSGRIHLDDINSNDFERFLNFIYCNNKEVLKIYSLECLKGLIALGDRYMVDSVKAAAIETIVSKIPNCDIGDLVGIFEYGRATSEPKLINQAVTVIKSRFQSGGLSAIAACSRIYDLNAQTFYALLETLATIPGKACFDLIETYVKVNDLLDVDAKEEQPIVAAANTSTQSAVVPKETNTQKSIESKAAKEDNRSKADDHTKEFVGYTVIRKGDIVNMLLQLVNFQNMSAKDFCNGPAKSQLLDTATKLEILMGICTNK